MFRLMLAVFVLIVAGCPDKKVPPPKTEPAQKAEPAPPKQPIATPKEKPAELVCPSAAKVAPGATITVSRSPGEDEDGPIQVAAKDTAKVDLFKEPGGAVSRKLIFKKGKPIVYSERRVVVGEPLQLSVPGPQKVRLSFVDLKGELVGGDQAKTVEWSLGKDALVGYVVYGGEGSHYLVVDGCFVLVEIESDEKNPWDLKEQDVPGRQWWVKAKSGWLLVDNKFVAAKGAARRK